jgi:hypothetical protein
VRYTPTGDSWSYYTTASGLPSNDVRAIWAASRGGVRTIYIATDNGIGVYSGP